MPDDSKKWTLNMGCHDGTAKSRDSSTGEYDSLAECEDAVRKAEEFWTTIGRYVWHATAYGPNGEQEKLRDGIPYL